MTPATPSQELAAKDLHGFEWKFKHIYRGNFALIFVALFSFSNFSFIIKFSNG